MSPCENCWGNDWAITITSEMTRPFFQDHNRPFQLMNAAYPAQGLQSRSDIAKFRAISSPKSKIEISDILKKKKKKKGEKRLFIFRGKVVDSASGVVPFEYFCVDGSASASTGSDRQAWRLINAQAWRRTGCIGPAQQNKPDRRIACQPRGRLLRRVVAEPLT